MEKIPCIKCTPELWKYIKPYLEEWEYTPHYTFGKLESYPLLVINMYGELGTYNNIRIVCKNNYNRELVDNVEEFLERAAKLKGKTYKRKDMEFYGIEIKAGMIIVIDEPDVDNVPYIVFPRVNRLAVVKYGGTISGTWYNLEDFMKFHHDCIKGIYNMSSDKYALFGDILWEKGPKEVVLTKTMNKEYILCAAVKRLKRRQSCGNPYYEGTNDILDIELGYRHHDIYQRFIDEMDITPNAQGFYTSKGRFVDRKEAYKIALEAGQINEENIAFPDVKLLCSEALY